MKKLLKKLLLLTLGLVALAGLWVYFWIFYDLPSPEAFGTYLPASSAYNPVPLSEVPEPLRWATVVVEDQTFYSPSRSDPVAIARAIYYAFQCSEGRCLSERTGTIPRGLTVMLMFVSGQDEGDSARQGLRDLALTLRITRRYTRDEILEFYLNSMSYADQVYGVEAAAQFYFGKPVRELDLAECTLLTAIARIYHFDPAEDLQFVRERQAVILDLLVEHGYIDAEAAAAAKEQAVEFVLH